MVQFILSPSMLSHSTELYTCYNLISLEPCLSNIYIATLYSLPEINQVAKSQIMKVFLTVLSLCATSILTAQNVPVDFESNGNGANWTWTTFENDINPPLEIVSNPDPTGINTSSTVAKFTALQAGQPFAGCETMHGADIGSFTIDNSNSIIRITVWKNTISDVGIKLVRSDNWSLGEIKVPNTKTGEWEQLEFDFSAHVGNTYDQIVVFPDFDARTQDNIIYFDDLYGDLASSTGINTVSEESIKLYPNPATDQIRIQSKKAVESYTIIGLTGQSVLQGSVLPNNTLDISELPSGIYIFQCVIGSNNHMLKFSVE